MGRLWIYVLDGGQGLWANPADWLDGFFTLGEVTVVSVTDMVDKVTRRVGSRFIQNMLIAGHGSPGYQSVGAGTAVDTSGSKSLCVDAATGKLAGPADQQLRRLAPRFCRDAIITLGGCQVGKGTQGETLLKAVSNCFGGLPVQAGTANQRPFLPGMEGDVIRCTSTSCGNLGGGSWWASPGSWIQ
jgi:hypothetical protein